SSNNGYNPGTGLWIVGNLAAGATKSVEITALVVNISGSITNFAQVQTSSPSDPDSTPGNDTNNTPDEDDEDDATIDPILEADLELEKTANVNSAVVGDLVTYTLTVSNSGPATATGVTVQDILPSGLSYVSSNGAYVPATGIWTIGNIASGGNASIQITTLVTNISTAITNFAQVETSSPTDPDSTPGNDTNNTPNEDDEDDVTIQPGTPNEADLELSKSVNPTQASAGDFVTYTISVENKGSADATGVTVKDILPTEMSFVSSNNGYNPGTGLWIVGNLAAGATKSVEITALVVNISGSITNFAQVQT
ncbi:MAG: DUF11 domain-containing protein, partial [Desulfobacterales bacterium]|nr:DUF11 domain-containing protein [Desulfobacterales bacterium]